MTSTQNFDQPTEQRRLVFICYAHADNKRPSWVDELRLIIGPLEDEHRLACWSDKDIEMGTNWHEKIQAQLSSSFAAILLIGPEFLRSKYVKNSELPVLLKRAAESNLRIIPIVTDVCMYENHKFLYPDPQLGPEELKLSSLQFANLGSKPLKKMKGHERREIFKEVGEMLRAWLEREKGKVYRSAETVVNRGAFSRGRGRKTDEPIPEVSNDEIKPGEVKEKTNPSLMEFLDEVRESEKLENPSRARYNIVILGKAGAGKSTLINFLFEQAIRPTGAGKPVTPPGFHPQDLLINNVPITIFDTAGIELGKLSEWNSRLRAELNQRGPGRPVSEWFHTIIYCVDGAAARVGDDELNLLNDFISKGYKVIIVITKSGQISTKKRAEILKPIQEKFGTKASYVPVNSEPEEVSIGVIEQFGRPELIQEILRGGWESLRLRMPDRCVSVLLACIDAWYRRQKAYIKKHVEAGWPGDLADELSDACDEFREELAGEKIRELVTVELQTAFHNYDYFSKSIKTKLKVGEHPIELNVYLSSLPAPTLWEKVAKFFKSEQEKRSVNKDLLYGLLKEFRNDLRDEIEKSRPQFKKWIAALLRENK